MGIFESGKKELLIQKYPDTCGRSLSALVYKSIKSTAELYFRFLSEKDKSQCGETQYFLVCKLRWGSVSEACSVDRF